jgi:hypothetical protein
MEFVTYINYFHATRRMSSMLTFGFMPLNTIIFITKGENMVVQAGKYLSFHCSVRYLMRGIYVAVTWKFLRVMFPRDEKEERRVCKSMISEIA